MKQRGFWMAHIVVIDSCFGGVSIFASTMASVVLITIVLFLIVAFVPFASVFLITAIRCQWSFLAQRTIVKMFVPSWSVILGISRVCSFPLLTSTGLTILIVFCDFNCFLACKELFDVFNDSGYAEDIRGLSDTFKVSSGRDGLF